MLGWGGEGSGEGGTADGGGVGAELPGEGGGLGLLAGEGGRRLGGRRGGPAGKGMAHHGLRLSAKKVQQGDGVTGRASPPPMKGRPVQGIVTCTRGQAVQVSLRAPDVDGGANLCTRLCTQVTHPVVPPPCTTTPSFVEPHAPTRPALASPSPSTCLTTCYYVSATASLPTGVSCATCTSACTLAGTRHRCVHPRCVHLTVTCKLAPPRVRLLLARGCPVPTSHLRYPSCTIYSISRACSCAVPCTHPPASAPIRPPLHPRTQLHCCFHRWHNSPVGRKGRQSQGDQECRCPACHKHTHPFLGGSRRPQRAWVAAVLAHAAARNGAGPTDVGDKSCV